MVPKFPDRDLYAGVAPFPIEKQSPAEEKNIMLSAFQCYSLE